MDILADFRILFLTLHIFSMAVGLGGATVSDILFLKFLKDYRISKKEEEVLHVLKDVILVAMLVITISGIALYLPEMQRLNASPMFLIKAIATIVLLINGVALHMYVAPHLIHLNLAGSEHMGRAWHRLAFALGGISICSWYSVFLIAMLKEALPWSFASMVLLYCTLLVIAITASQCMEALLTKKAVLDE